MFVASTTLPCRLPDAASHLQYFLSLSLSCIYSHFPYMHIIFLPYWIKTVAIIYRHFPSPHRLLCFISLSVPRRELSPYHGAHTNSHWLLADTTAIKHEHTSAIIFHFHFGSLFSPFASVFLNGSHRLLCIFSLSCLAKSLIDCERWP